VGDAVVVAASRRVLGEAAIAQIGDRSLVAWTEGPIARLAILGRDGKPVSGIHDLNVPGTNAQDVSVLSAGDSFFLLYKHKYGSVLEGCDLVGRRVSPDGAVSGPAVLASDVCAATYPIYRATVRDRTLFVAHTSGYEGTGVSVVRWSAGGAPVQASTPGEAEQTSIRLLAPTADGLVLAWSVALQHEVWVGEKLDPSGRAASAPERLRIYEEGAIEWGTDQILQHHLRAGALEVRTLPWAAGPGRWHTVDVGARVRQARVVRAGGKAWAILEVATGGVRLVPLAADGVAAGPVSEISGTMLALDGAHGATLEVRDQANQVVWQSLACR